MIDDKLLWTHHIDLICNRISKAIGIMYKLHNFPTIILRNIYYALISPFLSYGILAWGSASHSQLERVFKLQKRAMRIINHLPFLAHTEPIFKSHKILKFYDIYQYEIAIFMYNCYRGLLPESLHNHFVLNCSVHNYVTRSCKNFHVPNVRTDLFKKSIFYRGPISWNLLSDEIKNSCSFNTFKRKYKANIITTYASF